MLSTQEDAIQPGAIHLISAAHVPTSRWANPRPKMRADELCSFLVTHCEHIITYYLGKVYHISLT